MTMGEGTFLLKDQKASQVSSASCHLVDKGLCSTRAMRRQSLLLLAKMKQQSD